MTADQEAVVVVMRTGGPRFADDVEGVCSRCGHGAYWRPHAPPYPKVCLECMGGFAGLAGVMEQLRMTPETRAELALWRVEPGGRA